MRLQGKFDVDHCSAQVHQQLQQQQRQVQEMYQQQLHEQQHKISLLQDLLEQQRSSAAHEPQEDFTNLDESIDELTPESVKSGFSKLKVRCNVSIPWKCEFESAVTAQNDEFKGSFDSSSSR